MKPSAAARVRAMPPSSPCRRAEVRARLRRRAGEAAGKFTARAARSRFRARHPSCRVAQPRRALGRHRPVSRKAAAQGHRPARSHSAVCRGAAAHSEDAAARRHFSRRRPMPRRRKAQRFDKLANAVLRRVSEKGAEILSGLDGEALNIPAWMFERWQSAYGDDMAREHCARFAAGGAARSFGQTGCRGVG